MRIVKGRPLPRVWAPIAKGLVCEFDIRLTPRSRLAAKVLVFSKRRELQAFFRSLSPEQNWAWTVAAVNQLRREKWRPRKGSWLEVDPRYFCVAGFIVDRLGMEVIAHESVHVGFAYYDRIGKRSITDRAVNLEEEYVAYPAGRFASLMTAQLFKQGLLIESKKGHCGKLRK